MEELGYSGYFYLGDDLWICPHNLCRAISSDACSKYQLYFVQYLDNHSSVLIIIFQTDFGSASQMLCRDNQHWVCCVQNSWLTLVSVSLLVFFDNLQLLFLWRELGWLFWSSWQQNSKQIILVIFVLTVAWSTSIFFSRNFCEHWSNTTVSSHFRCILEVSCGSSCR